MFHCFTSIGESGVGKTAIINHMLKELEKEGGTSMEKTSTALGCVMQYSEKQSSLLENISSLTSFNNDDEDKTLDLLLGREFLVQIYLWKQNVIEKCNMVTAGIEPLPPRP